MFVDIYDQSTDVIFMSYLSGRDDADIQMISILEKGDEIIFGDDNYTVVKRILSIDGTTIQTCRIVVEPCKE